MCSILKQTIILSMTLDCPQIMDGMKIIDYRWDKEIYPEDSASFLANASRITNDIDELYITDFETDVTYTFKMESEDSDYRVYLKCFCCCYERMLLLIANNLCFYSI